MTITYSLDVSKARFCGFAKLLARWKGSIYKILWKEFFIFCVGYAAISITYRCFLETDHRIIFEKVVLFVETFTDLIPLSFVLGFYVSLVVGRWWAQYDAIPWPDRLCLMIASYVHGADERSRMIRRTLGRYLILAQALTFQSVSTSVKRRFPTTQHLVAAGIMTKEELTVYDKISFEYGKWWVPCHWFCSLLMRAKKEGRIKDSILLEGLFRELLNFRNSCGTMMSYDWISVPLVYTQVVTLATYMYAASLMVGRQYLDTSKGYANHQVDLYVPFFTILQFVFYVGWLKVAEQIVNPYGEDDDDFELNWCLDRSVHVVFLIVDQFQTKHPKIRKDFFWNEIVPRLPQTKHSAKGTENPQLGSAFNLEVEDAKYLQMDTLLEQDKEENMYSSDSFRQRNMDGYRSSFIMKILNSRFGQSFRKKSVQLGDTIKSSIRSPGHGNPTVLSYQGKSTLSTPTISRKSSFRSFKKKTSPSHSRNSSISFRPNSVNLYRYKSYDAQEQEKPAQSSGGLPDADKPVLYNAVAQANTLSASADSQLDGILSGVDEEANEQDIDSGGQRLDILMPPIPEEPSRDTSLISIQSGDIDNSEVGPELDGVQNLVKEANEVLKELNRTISAKSHRQECESKGYESCCSISSDVSSSDESSNESCRDVEPKATYSNNFAVILESNASGV